MKTNTTELSNNYAQIQVKMLTNKQIAFMGTHDLVDHLLDGNSKAMITNNNFFTDIQNVFIKNFNTSLKKNNSKLILSYLIGVLLDDLAQPIHYKSQKHIYVIKKCLSYFKKYNLKNDKKLFLDQFFSQLISEVRDKESISKKLIDTKLNRFLVTLTI